MADEEYEWTISPQARKQVMGILRDLEQMTDATQDQHQGALAAALLMSMAVERAALMQIQAAEKMEIVKMQGGPKILKI